MNKLILFFLLFNHTSFFIICGQQQREKLSEKNYPLVLAKHKGYYSFPTHYSEVDGYVQQGEEIQTFFCPYKIDVLPSSDEYCLAPIDGDDSFCKYPVEPLLIKSIKLDMKCGPDERSSYYEFVYRICYTTESTNEQNENTTPKTTKKSEDFLIYRICYDTTIQQTIFTFHEIISSTLIYNQNLKKENGKSIEISTKAYVIFQDYFTGQPKLYKWYNAVHFIKWRFHKIRPLLLVSPEDMVFDLWKKPLYHYANVKPSWKNVIKVWNIVNKYLQKMVDCQKCKLIQVNGSMDDLTIKDKPVYLNKSKGLIVPKYIWKLAYIPSDGKIVAIIFHNVPNIKYISPPDTFCQQDDNYSIRNWNLEEIKNLEKYIFFCDPKVITERFHLPEFLDLLEKKENFLPLILEFRDGYYRFTQTYEGLQDIRNQYLFCPSDTKNYLIPNEANNLYCSTPIQFNWEKSTTPCGVKKKAFLHNFQYDIAFGRGRSSQHLEGNEQTLSVILFSICYNENKKETIYTYHQINSPNLLLNSSLKEENVRNNFLKDKINIKKDNFKYLKKDYIPNKFYTFHFQHKFITIREMLIIPPEDMAFPYWRKPTYSDINVKLAWEEVIELWFTINKQLRSQAIEKNQEIIQINGTIGEYKISGSTVLFEQAKLTIPIIFWKIVYSPDLRQSILIIVHNNPYTTIDVVQPCDKIDCDIRTKNMAFSFLVYCCDAQPFIERYDLPRSQVLFIL